MSLSPAVVKKWVPRQVRQTIRRYWPEYLNKRARSMDNFVEINIYGRGSNVKVLLKFEFGPICIVEHLNDVFKNAKTDWLELVEVAAWIARLDNPDHIALAKQVASDLGTDNLYLRLSLDECAAYRGYRFEQLRRVVFS